VSADLSYFIQEGVLVGKVGERPFHILAVSGGGGGSTAQRPAASMNNPYMEAFKTADKTRHKPHAHGGPIPPGIYAIRPPAHNAHLGLSAALVLERGGSTHRSGFYIHGRGPHGSDGCIVPLDTKQFQQLMAALKAAGGGKLSVLETMGEVRFA
jgi:hypothetical protein